MELKIVVVPPHPLYSFFLSTSREDFALPNMAENWGHRWSRAVSTKDFMLLVQPEATQSSPWGK